MPESRLTRTREAYRTIRLGDTVTVKWPRMWPQNYGSEEKPETRCICGAALNEPHAPQCYRHPRHAEITEHGYGMGI